MTNEAAIRRLPMRVNIKGCDQAAPPRPGERIGPGGTFESSPLRSGGSRFFKSDPSRKRTIDRLLALARRHVSQGPRVRSSLRDGAIFNAFSHHFVVGYFQTSLPPSPRRRYAVARPSFCGRAVDRRAKAAFRLRRTGRTRSCPNAT
jgi:hypothetical protein